VPTSAAALTLKAQAGVSYIRSSSSIAIEALFKNLSADRFDPDETF
jgi:hypothetical protein